MSGLRVGVVGATGQVGGVLRRLLVERSFPVGEIRFFASSRSAGTTLDWGGREVVVEDATTADATGLDIVIFSAGAIASRGMAERFVAGGAMVIESLRGLQDLNWQKSISGDQCGVISRRCTKLDLMHKKPDAAPSKNN